MNNGLKIGYIMVGAGLGLGIACYLYERELCKPVGEVEEYIPKSDEDKQDEEVTKTDDSVSVTSEFTNSDTHILDFYKSDSKDPIGAKDLKARARNRREEFEKARSSGNRNQTTRYSKMYDDGSNEKSKEQIVQEALKDQRAAYEDYARRSDQQNKVGSEDSIDIFEDGPSDDGVYHEDYDPDVDLVKERVENNFEIYLGENPQDFVSLVFYEGDNTLTDDREHVVPAADEVVGMVALSRLIEGGAGAENGVIYVRNLKTMINYEIVLDSGSYKETVLGILDSRRNKGAGGDVYS